LHSILTLTKRKCLIDLRSLRRSLIPRKYPVPLKELRVPVVLSRSRVCEGSIFTRFCPTQGAAQPLASFTQEKKQAKKVKFSGYTAAFHPWLGAPLCMLPPLIRNVVSLPRLWRGPLTRGKKTVAPGRRTLTGGNTRCDLSLGYPFRTPFTLLKYRSRPSSSSPAA